MYYVALKCAIKKINVLIVAVWLRFNQSYRFNRLFQPLSNVWTLYMQIREYESNRALYDFVEKNIVEENIKFSNHMFADLNS